MGFSAFYQSARDMTDEQALSVLNCAYDNGVELFNTATFYGPLNEDGYGANLRLLNKFLHQTDKVIDRSKVKLMVKVGMDTRCPVEKTGQVWNNRADAEGLRADIDYALKTLGVDYIDIVVLCRVSPTVPIEESVAALQAAVTEGKAKAIGLSEASGSILRRAQAVAPIFCIEQEWSLWTRDIEEELLPVCREFGTTIVAYSPLGRGFLTGTINNVATDLDAKDFRVMAMPRFSAENYEHNLRLLETLKQVAAEKGVPTSEIALAWLYAQYEHVIPIPGTTKIVNLQSNLRGLQLELTSEEVEKLSRAFDPSLVQGNRYAHMAMTFHGNK